MEDELYQMEDTFRNQNLLIQAIRESQEKQAKSLKHIQLKLNEINQIKEFCEETKVLQRPFGKNHLSY